MIRQSCHVALVAIALILTACSSSPTVNYYSLSYSGAASGAKAEGSPIVGIGPLRMPEYLKGKRIITRSSDTQVNMLEFDRWTEPVEESFHRVVANNVDGQVGDIIVVGYPYMHMADVDYRVTGQIERFDADAAGNVILDVQWDLADTENKMLVAPRRDRYQVSTSAADDIAAIVAAMNEALSQFSQDVASSLNTALK